MNKEIIRNIIKQKKSELSQEYIENESNKILEKLLAHPSYIHSKYIFTYVSFNQEVRTSGLIKRGFQDKKKIAVPKIINKRLEFIWIDNLSSYETSNIGINEPIEENMVTKSQLKSLDNILMIVPGLAFDKYKNRIGYGKGFYDNYFAENMSVPFKKIGITYDFQIMEDIVPSDNDIKIDEIISQSYHIV